jgi:hypothetical protein
MNALSRSAAPRRSPRTLRPNRATSSPILLAGLAAIALAFASPRTASAVYVQDRFMIGAWGGGGNTTPYISSYMDTCEVRRQFESFARCRINTVGFPVTAFGTTAAKQYLRIASSYGLRVVGGLPTISEAQINDATEWAAFAGYFYGSDSDDGFPPTEGARADVAAMHAASPDKFVSTYTNKIGNILEWYELEAENERVDAWHTQNQMLEGFPAGYPVEEPHNWEVDQSRVIAQTAPHPVWPWSYVTAVDGLWCPTEQTLTRMGLWPPLLGAKGVVWWAWDMAPDVIPGSSYLLRTRPAFVDGHIVTATGRTVGRINHYLEDVVGPAVMRSTYVGIYHDTCQVDEPWVLCSSNPQPSESRPVIYRLSDHTMLGLLQSNDEAPGTYYLLVGNRSETARTSTISLKGHRWFKVGAAPSVVGYVGASGYSPVTTTLATRSSSFAEDSITTFSVSLAGSEVRMFRIVPDDHDGHFARLVEPTGGETWTAGESETVEWSGITSDISVRLYTDVAPGAGLTGPYVVLGTQGSGSSMSITVPAVATSRGRIAVTGKAPDNTTVTVIQQVPLTIGTVAFQNLGHQALLRTNGFAFASLAHASDGDPQVVAMGDTAGWVRHIRRDSGTWSVSTVNDSQGNAAPVLQYGRQASLVADTSDVLHAAYFTLFTNTTPSDDPENPDENNHQSLRYQRYQGGTWTRDTVDYVGTSHGNCAIALDGSGAPVIAYNAGAATNHGLRIVRRNGGLWEPAAPDLNTAANSALIDPLEIEMKLSNTGFFEGQLYVSFLNRRTGTLHVYTPDPEFWLGHANITGVEGHAAMTVADDGYGRVAYTTKGTTPGSHRLYYRKEVLDEGLSTVYFLAAELVDSLAIGVGDVRIASAAGVDRIVYAANGALVRAVKVNGAWTRSTVDLEHDADGPVQLDVMSNGEERIVYRDATADMLRMLIIPGSGGGGGGGGGGEEPPQIETAIAMHGANPLQFGSKLVFELRASRTARVELELYDVAGRRVADQPVWNVAPGMQRLEWTPREIRAGVYFLRARVNGKIRLNRRLVFIR